MDTNLKIYKLNKLLYPYFLHCQPLLSPCKVKVQDFLWGYGIYRVQYRSGTMSLIDEDSFSTPVGVP